MDASAGPAPSWEGGWGEERLLPFLGWVATMALPLQDTWPLSLKPGKLALLRGLPRPPVTGDVEKVLNKLVT